MLVVIIQLDSSKISMYSNFFIIKTPLTTFKIQLTSQFSSPSIEKLSFLTGNGVIKVFTFLPQLFVILCTLCCMRYSIIGSPFAIPDAMFKSIIQTSLNHAEWDIKQEVSFIISCWLLEIPPDLAHRFVMICFSDTKFRKTFISSLINVTFDCL